METRNGFSNAVITTVIDEEINQSSIIGRLHNENYD